MATSKTGRAGASGVVVLGEGPAPDAVAADALPLGLVKVKPVPEPVWPVDEFTGVGGRFVRDPVSGVRRPAEPDEAV